MNEAALNGDYGPEAQANEVLAEVDRRIQAALSTVPLKPGNAHTQVLPGYPVIISRKGNEP